MAVVTEQVAPTAPLPTTGDNGNAGGLGTRIVLGAPLTLWQLAFFLVPVLLMCAMTLWTVTNFRLTPALSLDAWQTTLGSSVFWEALVRTLILAAVAGTLGVVLAVPFAYAIVRSVPGKRLNLALAALIVPYFTSYLARVFSWNFMLSDNGVINRFLESVSLPEIHLLGRTPALMIGYLTYSLPLLTLIVALSLMSADRTLEQAAKNLGYTPWQTFLRVVLPALRPSVVAAGAFGAILAFGDVITPQVLGGGNFTLLGTLVTDSVKGGVNYPSAATIGVAMVIVIMLLVLASFRLAFPRGMR